MMKKIGIFLLILLMTCAGCSQLPVDQETTLPSTVTTTEPQQTVPLTTLPPETTAPIETTTPTEPAETTVPVTTPVASKALLREEIEALEAVYTIHDFLTLGFPTNWYNASLITEFTSPKELNVTDFFDNQGTKCLDDYDLTDKELEFLHNYPRISAHMEMGVDVYRIPRAEVERLLELHFGLAPGDVPIGSSNMVYWDKTDCYYVCMDGGGTYFFNFEVLEARYLDNTTIWFKYHDAGSSLGEREAVIRLRRDCFKLLSNRYCVDHAAPPELDEHLTATPLTEAEINKLTQLFSISYDNGSVLDENYYNTALCCVFASADTISLKQLFYNGIPENITDADRESNLFGEGKEIRRYQPEQLDQILTKHLGITMDDVDWYFQKWFFKENDGTYYTAAGDYCVLEGFEIWNAYRTEDGLIHVYYFNEQYDMYFDVVLQGSSNKGYQIISNLPA